MFGNEQWQVWLDACDSDSSDQLRRHSYLGIGRSRVIMGYADDAVVVERCLQTGVEKRHEGTIFDFLREEIDPPSGDETDSSGFRLGWAGWFGFELGAQTTGAPVAPTKESDVPDACFIFLDRLVEFDHNSGEMFAVYFDGDVEWAEIVRDAALSIDRQESLFASTHEIVGESHTLEPKLESVKFRFTRPEYEELISTCLDEIRSGNVYQACLTNRVEFRFDEKPDPHRVYERLRRANPSHHGGFITTDGVSLLSTSPEVFLRISVDGTVTTKPIKGTRSRGLDHASDAALAEELRTDEKEVAENVMIVDLMRNDLSRVSVVGSVEVQNLLNVETYANVHQLVSTVTSSLRPGLNVVDVVEACFPAGSMTGAPKLAALKLLHRLEAGPRGIYSGAFGYLSLDGSSELAMVIRSIVMTKNLAMIGTGGGITSGSHPHSEWNETILKVRPLVQALSDSHDVTNLLNVDEEI